MPVASEGPQSLPAPSSGRGLEGLRLLVVDDEHDALESLGALLETEGARVRMASGAERALELFQGEAFDAVVSDVAMPGSDGYWLAKRLLAIDPARGVPLVAISGRARGIDRARALEAGFEALVSKPIDLDDLRLEIVEALQKRADRKA